MRDNHKLNRDITDFVLTDLLPYEKGNHFTNRHFYDYIQDHKKTFHSVTSLVAIDRGFNQKWHSAPLGFFISKKHNSFRQISLINPLGLLQSLVFIKLFENDIINILHNRNDFSTRKAERTNQLSYKKRDNQTVYYSGKTIEKKQFLISLESSGTYFNHKFKTIKKLLESEEFNFSKDKYKYLLKLDVQSCFSSIYTHSYKWLITNKLYDSKGLSSKNNIYTVIDKYLQNINGSKSNGIIVGPEVSRLLADFLFVHLDQKLVELLNIEQITKNRDYKIFRFVDDYYIFTNNEKIQDNIENKLSKVLNEFQLKLNDSKISKYKTSEFVNDWYYEISPINEKITKIFDESKELKDLYEIRKEANRGNNKEILKLTEGSINYLKKITNYNFSNYLHLKNQITISINFSNEPILISSYLLTTMLSKIEENRGIEKSFYMETKDIINLIFFLYSKSVTYSSTQKVIRSLSLLLEKDFYQAKMSIERSVITFESFIFTDLSSDWIDLLLFFQSYDLNISKNLFNRITNQILKEENPVTLAALCIFLNTSNTDSRNISKKINDLIKHKVDTLNWEEFFADENSWWVFVFISYPKLRKNLKKDLTSKLTSMKQEINSKNKNPQSSYIAQELIIDFLLNEKIHFIEWDFTSLNYYKEFYFYTRDRTVFNPDILDQINISR